MRYRTRPQVRRWWRCQSLPKDFAQTRHSPAARKPRGRQRQIWLTYRFLLISETLGENPALQQVFHVFRVKHGGATLQSEAAPVRRHAVIPMQLGFLRAIAPVEILVGTE